MSVRAIIAAVLVTASAMPATAAARIYCAASDPMVKMSIESAFAARDGKRLVHFRGITDIKDDKAPEAFANLKLNSAMLKQAWMDGDELRLQIYTDTRDVRPFQTFEMSIVTRSSAKDPDRFAGRYVLTVESGQGKRKAPRDMVLSHEAAISCEIK
ncbi:MAG: hypothetical protein K0M55_04445 [Rhizobium sp.]|nr:hypothetical protein [Rhizobium sp.]